MEFQLEKTDFVDSEKAKTSQRITYEAQAEVIKRQIGELEIVREKLGLSARKISQLLMVDPSAWTRWTKNGDGAPPHIWRALQWYMILQQKVPGLTPQFFIEKETPHFEKASKRLTEIEKQISEKHQEIFHENERLQKKIRALEASVKANRVGFVLMGISALILSYAFFRMIRS
jgi:hypothetical protein